MGIADGVGVCYWVLRCWGWRVRAQRMRIGVWRVPRLCSQQIIATKLDVIGSQLAITAVVRVIGDGRILSIRATGVAPDTERISAISSPINRCASIDVTRATYVGLADLASARITCLAADPVIAALDVHVIEINRWLASPVLRGNIRH